MNVTCPDCNGLGGRVETRTDGPHTQTEWINCRECGGAGVVSK